MPNDHLNQPERVLAILRAAGGKRVPMDQLAAALFGAGDDRPFVRRARHVRVIVSKLRQRGYEIEPRYLFADGHWSHYGVGYLLVERVTA